MRWAVSKVVTDEAAPSPSKKARREETEDDVQAEPQKKSLPKKMKKSDAAPMEDIKADASEAVAEPASEPVEETDNKE